MTIPAKLLTEMAGTFLFFSVIALSGRLGPMAPAGERRAAAPQRRHRKVLGEDISARTRAANSGFVAWNAAHDSTRMTMWHALLWQL